ncbi:hypothetical protein COV22_03495, partial [Candidatus Woesearchaeota archaeon CG10_big_fil_rev_8_21_14_0_10_47_5]
GEDRGEAEENTPRTRGRGKAGKSTARAMATGSRGIESEFMHEKLALLDDARKSVSERLTHISEQLGEIRSSLAEKEKKISQVEALATKAADLVSEVQPENLAIETKKLEGRLEKLGAKINGQNEIIAALRDELRELKGSVGKFRGVDEILRLSRDVRSNLETMLKIHATVEQHSDRVEGMFIEMQKRTSELNQLKVTIQASAGDLDMLKREFSAARARMMDAATKKELSNMIESISETKQDVINKIGEADAKLKELSGFSSHTTEVEEEINSLSGELSDGLSKLSTIIATVSELTKEMDSIRSAVINIAKSSEANNEFMSRIMNEIHRLQEETKMDARSEGKPS